MTKKSIFREHFSWKVSIFATQLTIAPFCCSISPTNCNLKRDFKSTTKYTLELRAIAQTSTIVYLGLLQACRRIWTGPAYSMLKSKHFL